MQDRFTVQKRLLGPLSPAPPSTPWPTMMMNMKISWATLERNSRKRKWVRVKLMTPIWARKIQPN